MEPSLLQKLWPVFVEEAREHLQEIAAGVLELEKGTAPDGLLTAMRRTAHGLKGSASSLGLSDLEKLSHAIESALVGRTEKQKLEGARVEALLAAVDAGEEALRRGDAGRDPTVEALESLLAALSGVEAPPPAPAPAEPSALEQMWPVFRAEASDHAARVKKTLADARPGAPLDPAEADALTKIAQSLRSSARLLGAQAMEKSAARLQDLLTACKGCPSAKQLEGLGQAVTALEAALGPEPVAAPDPGAAGESAQAEPESSDASEADDPAGDATLNGIFAHESMEALAALEGSILALVAPNCEGRPQVVEDAVRRAHNLKGSAGAIGALAIAETAGRLQGTLAKMAEPGIPASKAAASAAEDLVGLREALDAFARAADAAPEPRGGAAEPAAASSAAEASAAPGAEPGGTSTAAALSAVADRTIRVSVNTLESVARQVEGFTLLRAREERRGREIAAQASALAEVRALCQRALEELRHAEQHGPMEVLDEALSRLRQQERALARVGQEQTREAEQIRLVSTVVREDLRDLRMVPSANALEPLRRTVREVSGRVGKPVDLVLKGGDVRLDRRILDELKEPLQHLVRNAIDHGIEPAEARKAAGKPPVGSLEVRVERRGHRIAVVVEDDGAGMSAERVRQAAVRRGLLTPQEAAQMLDAEVLRLVFKAGFSTAEKVTAISGRGVGLDVVQATAHKLRGAADLWTELGKGTRFTMDLPLTLAATLAVVVRCGQDSAALPYEAVERILRLTAKDLGTVAGRAAVLVEGVQLPFASLAQVVGSESGRLPGESSRAQPAVLVNAGGARLVLAVDEVAGQHEVVVHPLGKHLSRTAHLAGAAVLEDGRVVSVLNVAELVRQARPLTRRSSSAEEATRVLVVDDSLTTRSAMKAVLEIAGYQVVPAADGEEALALLKQTPCVLVVTDVQMPRMDGLTLTKRIKADPKLAGMPVIVVTSLDTPGDRAAGLEAGADGYLVKRDVERGKLLELVRQLMPVRESRGERA
ncbi:MAG TPA: hybrid sensor histidine kinase/response regulator [Myxococcales bacterium]